MKSKLPLNHRFLALQEIACIAVSVTVIAKVTKCEIVRPSKRRFENKNVVFLSQTVDFGSTRVKVPQSVHVR